MSHVFVGCLVAQGIIALQNLVLVAINETRQNLIGRIFHARQPVAEIVFHFSFHSRRTDDLDDVFLLVPFDAPGTAKRVCEGDFFRGLKLVGSGKTLVGVSRLIV